MFFVRVVTNFFGDRTLYQITPFDIEDFKTRRKETQTQAGKIRSEVSVNRELEVLRHMLNKSVEWGMLNENPFSKFKESIFFEEKNDRVRFLEEDEILKLLDVCPAYLKYIIKGAIFTGLRKGDLLSLKKTDINIDRGFLNYREQKKGGRVRVKELNDDMIALLTEIPKGESEYVFCGPNGKPVKDVGKAFRTALRKAGIKDFHFHDLRHTSASHLLMRGASLKTIQEHLGHTSISMTQRYSHLSRNFQREEIQKLNGLCGENSQPIVSQGGISGLEGQGDMVATA